LHGTQKEIKKSTLIIQKCSTHNSIHDGNSSRKRKNLKSQLGLWRLGVRYAKVTIDDSRHCICVAQQTLMIKALRETQTLRAGCGQAGPKISAPPQTPFPGAQDGQNLISWRWSLPSPTDPI